MAPKTVAVTRVQNKSSKTVKKVSTATKKIAPVKAVSTRSKKVADERQPRIMEAMAKAAAAAEKKKKSVSPSPTLIPVYLRASSEIPAHALRQDRRSTPNKSDCFHCRETHCRCQKMEQILMEVYASCERQRIAEFGVKKELCAKSVLPNFVTRMISLLDLKPGDTFVDLGCGNGSVLYQVALMCPGVRCIGVEIEENNAAVAREGWPLSKKKFLGRRSTSAADSSNEIKDVEIITGSLQQLILSSSFAQASRGGRMAVWVSNKLFPGGLNQFIGDRFRRLPPGCRVMCMEDLYPHQRAVAASRDPQAFELFEMTDICWPQGAVEWCRFEGMIHLHVRTQAEHPDGSITE